MTANIGLLTLRMSLSKYHGKLVWVNLCNNAVVANVCVNIIAGPRVFLTADRYQSCLNGFERECMPDFNNKLIEIGETCGGPFWAGSVLIGADKALYIGADYRTGESVEVEITVCSVSPE